jgi:hypothetical protein
LNSWIDDFETRPVNADIADCPTCQVHRGFKACNDNTIANVTAGVRQLTAKYPSYTLIVTGHSLGKYNTILKYYLLIK